MGVKNIQTAGYNGARMAFLSELEIYHVTEEPTATNFRTCRTP